MKKQPVSTILIFFILTGVSISLQAQRANGLIFDDASFQQIELLQSYDGKKYNAIPLMVSYRKQCPFPNDQGNIGSCVGEACSAALTITKAILHKTTERDKITRYSHSAAYIYNQIKVNDDCRKGARFLDALKLLAEQGCCLASTFPNSQESCSDQPREKDRAEAAQFKIKEAAAIFHPDDSPDVKITQTQKLLAAGSPVLIGMEIPTSFLDIQNGQKFWTPTPQETIEGGHAMVVVGFDRRQKAFELLNSYGTNWGDQGFIWIKEEHFGRLTKYGFIIVASENTPFAPRPNHVQVSGENPIELKGTFVFQHLEEQGAGKNGLHFKPVETYFNEENQIYGTVQETWKAQEAVFQLVAKNIPAGKSAYIFSIDAANKLELHWPPYQGIDQFHKVKLSSIIPSEDAEIIIPGEDEGLLLAEKGEDNLCILYSNFSIGDLEARLKKVAASKGAFKDRVNAGFADLLVPQKNIRYSLDEMSFTCLSSDPKRYVVPIILKVTAE